LSMEIASNHNFRYKNRRQYLPAGRNADATLLPIVGELMGIIADAL